MRLLFIISRRYSLIAKRGSASRFPRLYNKQDITEINLYGVRYSRSLWNECEVFKIIFKNGEEIQFTSLLINGDRLLQKFPDHPVINNRKPFPRFESV
jgi:hypothetical protein